MRIPILTATVALVISNVAWAAEPDPEMVSVEGRHIILKLYAEDMALLDDPKAWVDKLDRAYEALADLVGDVPFDGEKITITSADDLHGAWARCGNPIKWKREYIGKSFQENVNKGDWLFGIVHEISHNFDLDYRWVWDAELWANIKLEFVVEALDATVVFYWQAYRGEELRSVFANSYADARSRGEYNWAVIHVRFAELRDDYGWEPFKEAFRAYPPESDPDCPSSLLGKFLLFIDLLSEASGEDIQARFETGEWEWMVGDLSA